MTLSVVIVKLTNLIRYENLLLNDSVKTFCSVKLLFKPLEFIA